MVWVEWSKFWDAWSAADVPEKDLMIACCRVVDAAAEELSGGRAYRMAQLISDDFLRNKMLEYSTRIGEPGELRLVDGQAPSDICRRFRELLRSKNIRIPAALNHPHGV